MDNLLDIVNDETRYTDRKPVRILGRVASQKLTTTKSGQSMCFVDFEDITGKLEMVVFPKIYDQYERLLRSGEPLIAEGTVSLREDEEPEDPLQQAVFPEGFPAVGEGDDVVYQVYFKGR